MEVEGGGGDVTERVPAILPVRRRYLARSPVTLVRAISIRRPSLGSKRAVLVGLKICDGSFSDSFPSSVLASWFRFRRRMAEAALLNMDGAGEEGKGREGKGGIFKLPSKQAGTTTFWIKTMTVMCLMDAFVGTIRPQRVRDEVRKSQNTSERSPFRVYACYDPYWARIISRYLFFGETFVRSLRTFNLKNLETSFPGSPHP